VEESRTLKDGFGRTIDYLRLSVTDRCNLRCTYCMPDEGVGYIPCEKILRYEEMVRLSDIFIDMGIRKIRITGGEPLLRKNILFLLGELGKRQLGELVLTTNGVLLSRFARGLVESGIQRVNVSLDSLREKAFRAITGSDGYGEVMEGIEKADRAGLRLKINVVAMRGINDDEFFDFVRFGSERGLALRFIEVMPQFYSEAVVRKRFISAEGILERIKKKYRVESLESEKQGSVERLYRIDKTGFTFGVIGAISEPFCSRCNRVRLMANGVVKTCLFGPEGPNLKRMLMDGASSDEIERTIRDVVMLKPAGHYLDESTGHLVMHRVGG
jgi:cyclic pyranopterin phosphate synthase